MMNIITAIWINNIAPPDFTREDFKDEAVYELFELVKKVYCIRKEIENYQQELRNGSPVRNLHEILTYERANLAKAEYKVEKLLIKMRK